MPDALRATFELMQASKEMLNYPNAYNVAAISADIASLAREIQKHIPHFKINHKVDPIR